MKIFVTGGTGFVGSYFINAAHDSGHELLCLKRKNSKSRIPLKKEPEWIEGDLNYNFIDELKGCEVLVHLAAHSANVPYDTLENCLYWNLVVSQKLFNQALEQGIQKYVVAGSGFEYGRSGEFYEYIPVDAPLYPTMSYPASKAAASVAFIGWATINKVKLKLLRIFQVFGEGEDKKRLWPSLKKAAIEGKDLSMTKGEQIRDFINVKDVAQKIVEYVDFNNSKPGVAEIYNIGSGKPRSIKEFAEEWWKRWGGKGTIRFGEIPYRENEVMRYVPKV
jgi:nucleoside-diphosphate-sugar epimerase